MKRLALLLQIAVVFVGVAVLAFLLGTPHIEGRNAHATAFEVYFKDPFLAYVYVASLPFFVGLYRAFGLCGDIRRNDAFTQVTVDGLRVIGRCALVLIGFVAGGVVFLLVLGEPEPPGIVISVLVALASGLTAFVARMSARKLQGILKQSAASHA